MLRLAAKAQRRNGVYATGTSALVSSAGIAVIAGGYKNAGAVYTGIAGAGLAVIAYLWLIKAISGTAARVNRAGVEIIAQRIVQAKTEVTVVKCAGIVVVAIKLDVETISVAIAGVSGAFVKVIAGQVAIANTVKAIIKSAEIAIVTIYERVFADAAFTKVIRTGVSVIAGFRLVQAVPIIAKITGAWVIIVALKQTAAGNANVIHSKVAFEIRTGRPCKPEANGTGRIGCKADN